MTIARARMRDMQARPASGKQLLAQRALAILGLVDAARLQFGNYQVDKRVERFRRDQAEQVEAVDVGFIGPGDQFVRDILGDPITKGERAPIRLRLARSPTLIGRSLRTVKFSTIDWIALLSTYCAA